MNKGVRAFAAALGAGLLAGALYAVIGVPTPAPPWWALCGLLGIVRRRTRRRRGPGAAEAAPRR